jgi:hypothetical protein
MARSNTAASAARSTAAVADANDLRSTIATALADAPIDEDTLRRGVWTFVRAERDAGAQPGEVIIDLTAIVEAAPTPAGPARQARIRQVILWCVEAYFGHLGGNDVRATFTPSPPRAVSNR